MDCFEYIPAAAGPRRVYIDFYKLKEPPFSITPDPEFLFLSQTHQQVIEKMLYGIEIRAGFILLSGEVGTGKTTVCRSIIDTLIGTAEVVYIINPSVSGKALISCILDDLGIRYAADGSKKDLIERLNHFLLYRNRSTPVVIIIDDAQTMPIEALEDLRLLSNLETDKEKMLQMVIVGQPEIERLLARPEMRQLNQRIFVKCLLERLKPKEISAYIDRRLFIAGSKGQIQFTGGAQQRIARYSHGIPRLINKICDYALTAGYTADEFVINKRHVQRALFELGDREFKTPFWIFNPVSLMAKKLFFACMLSVVVFVIFFLWPTAAAFQCQNLGINPLPTERKSIWQHHFQKP